jgi:hypothetical protein
MIISAVSRCIDKLDRKDVYFMSDDALIKELKKKGTEASIRLLENLESRQLYKPVYGLRYEGELSSRAEDKQELIEELRQTENRVKAETYLEKTNGLEPGSIVVYCPGEEMGHKAVKAIVNLNGRIGPLDEIGPPRVKEEIRSSITERHLELWAMYVFADRDLPDDVKGHIQHECTRLFGGLQNEIEDAKKYYDKNSIPYQIRYEERYAKEHKKQQMSSEEVLHIAARSKEGDDAKYNCLSYEEYYQLREGL